MDVATTTRTQQPTIDPGVLMRHLPWHPALFATVVVVTVWLDAAISPFAAVRSLALAVLLAVGLTALGSLAFRSLALGAFGASAAIGAMWSRQLIETVGDLASRMGLLAIGWAALFLAAAIVSYRVIRRSAPRLTRERTTAFLNRAGLLLLVATVVLGVLRGRFAAVGEDIGQGIDLAAWSGAGSASAGRPDIFVILLDGYPRADVLDYAFGLDNVPFTDALAERGFDVATHSHSDYLWTHVSVPSALNLAYVEQIPAMRDIIEGRAPYQPTLRTTVADSIAFDVGREHGYTTVAIGSGFEEVTARRADVYVDGGQLNEFEISLIASTFAGDVVGALAPDFASGQLRDRILHNLEVLPEIALRTSPALVFAHIPAPHQPAVFGDEGAPIQVPISDTFFADSPGERGEPQSEFIDRYRTQLPYLNEIVLEAIDGIVALADDPPVIVLFADHGSASAVDWKTTEPADADPARVLERTGILFAALTPGREDVFPDDISPVDLFRLLFDAYLGTDYGRATPPEGGGHIAPVDASVLDR